MYLKYTKYYVYKILFLFVWGNFCKTLLNRTMLLHVAYMFVRLVKELMHACLIMKLNSMQSAMY